MKYRTEWTENIDNNMVHVFNVVDKIDWFFEK